MIKMHLMHSHNFFSDECLPFIIKDKFKDKFYVNPLYVANTLLQSVLFDPLCITEDPTENDNRPFQYTKIQ